MLAYTLGSSPRDIRKIIYSVDNKRKNDKKFDEFFAGKSTRLVIDTLIDNDIVLKFSGSDLGNVQRNLIESICFEPVVRDNTPDKDIMEHIYGITEDDNLSYAIGKKELKGKECIVYNEIKKYYEDTCRKEGDIPYPRYAKTLTVRDLIMNSVCIEFTKDDLYGTIYELMNKNMLIVYEKCGPIC